MYIRTLYVKLFGGVSFFSYDAVGCEIRYDDDDDCDV